MTTPREVSLSPTSSEYQRLKHWLSRSQNGWSQSLATNPSTGVFVQAGDLRLQFTGGVAFAFTNKGQFQKEVRHEDYAFLEAVAGI